jgi:hypothetical protein
MEFCDMNCRHAEWPEDKALDGSASCRTFQAIYCMKKKRVVHKNGPCTEKERRPSMQSGRRVITKKKISR